MLVLSRKVDESIVICDQASLKVIAEVCLVGIRGDKVRLGSVADGLGIHRKEIYDKLVKEKESA